MILLLLGICGISRIKYFCQFSNFGRADRIATFAASKHNESNSGLEQAGMNTLVSPALPPAPGESRKLSESEAIRLAQDGDATGFEHLYQLHSRRVYATCLRITGSTAEAEDLTQEAFLRLFRKIKTFRGESAFSTWLHRLAVNVVLAWLRHKTIKDTSSEQSDEQEIGARDLLLSGVLDRMWLKDAITRLPEEYRMIISLRDLQGLEHHQIAAQLKCSVGASKSQLHRARVRLRKLLAGKNRDKS